MERWWAVATDKSKRCLSHLIYRFARNLAPNTLQREKFFQSKRNFDVKMEASSVFWLVWQLNSKCTLSRWPCLYTISSLRQEVCLKNDWKRFALRANEASSESILIFWRLINENWMVTWAVKPIPSPCTTARGEVVINFKNFMENSRMTKHLQGEKCDHIPEPHEIFRLHNKFFFYEREIRLQILNDAYIFSASFYLLKRIHCMNLWLKFSKSLNSTFQCNLNCEMGSSIAHRK